MSHVRNTSGLRRGGPGRPKNTPTLKGYLQKKYGHDSRKIVAEAESIAFDKAVSAKIRLQAIALLLDRSEGKPPQTLNHEGLPAVPLFALPDGVRPNIQRETKE